jgi:hypothetical protein
MSLALGFIVLPIAAGITRFPAITVGQLWDNQSMMPNSDLQFSYNYVNQ